MEDTTINFIDLLHEKEKQQQPTHLSSIQTEITEKYRDILIDWLWYASETLECEEASFFLTVNYIDYYISKIRVTKSDFQVIGLACLLIGVAIEEDFSLFASDIIKELEPECTAEQIMKKRIEILIFFEWRTLRVTPYTHVQWTDVCLEKVKELCEKKLEFEHLVQYLLCITESKYSISIKYYPMMKTAASIILATSILTKVMTYNEILADCMGYTVASLSSIMEDMERLFIHHSMNQNKTEIFKTFEKEERSGVSLINLLKRPYSKI